MKPSVNANSHCTLTVAGRKFLLAAALGLALTGVPATTAFAYGGNPARSEQQPQASRPGGEIRGSFPVTLSKSLDSKKLKDGDVVICQTAAALHARSGFLIPSGSKVIGHVTAAQARSKGDPQSSLAIAFDKIVIGKNEDIPIKGTVQAIAPSLGDSGPTTGAASPGTLPMGRNAGDAATMPPPSPSLDGVGPNSGIHPVTVGGSHPILLSDSQGVLGFHNMEMDKEHVITSSDKEIKLESGTQIMIRAEIETSAIR